MCIIFLKPQSLPSVTQHLQQNNIFYSQSQQNYSLNWGPNTLIYESMEAIGIETTTASHSSFTSVSDCTFSSLKPLFLIYQGLSLFAVSKFQLL